MKRVNKLSLIISFIAVVAACSAISVSASAENLRWTLESINPWNGIEGLAFVMGYLLNSGGFLAYTISIGLFVMLWWGLYVIIARLAR